jgi:hypothetical protein
VAGGEFRRAAGQVSAFLARWGCPFEHGDLNCDGAVNGYDIDPFVLALTDPAGYDAAFPACDFDLADVDYDGAVNGYDIDPFVRLLTGSSGR